MDRLLLLRLALIVGCSSQNGEERIFIEEIEIESDSLLVNTEISTGIRTPSGIKAVTGEFLLYDNGHQKLHKLDTNGTKLLTFENEGKGPGEFQMISSFYELVRYCVELVKAFKNILTEQTSGQETDEDVKNSLYKERIRF